MEDIMMTDNQILLRGMEALANAIGIVEAEKFISIIIRDSSDYTEWRKNLFKGKSLDEINNEAKNYWEENK